MFNLFALLNLVASGLLFGAMMEVVVADIPLFLELAPEPFVVVHHGIDKRKHPYMPILSAIAIIACLGELWFHHTNWQIGCAAIGIGAVLAVATVSETINVPLNRKIKAWETSSIVGDVLKMRTQWIRGHYLRTAAGALAFLAFLTLMLTVL